MSNTTIVMKGPQGPDQAVSAPPPSHVTVEESTFHSIGISWDMNGDDADHNAVLSVRYRKNGSGLWSTAMPLVRNQYAWTYLENSGPEIDNFSGSIFFLTPGTTYQIELSYNDPDGTDAEHGNTYIFDVATRAIPVKPTGGNTYYVIPGGGGGVGSSSNPFQGLSVAQANAQPGDIFLLRDGVYSGITITTSGEEENWIVYQEDPDDPGATIDSTTLINADHIWFDNLSFVWDDPTNGATPIEDQSWLQTTAIAASPASSTPDDIIVTRCTFSQFFNGFFSFYPISRWVAMDNTMVGPWQDNIGAVTNPGATNGKALWFGGDASPGGPGCVAAYNEITQWADAIGLAANSDAYGNRCHDFWGNILNPDSAFGNVRFWGNVANYCAGGALTFQPQKIGPWYFMYNSHYSPNENWGSNEIMKWRTQDRMVFINNTFHGNTEKAQHFNRCIHKNNLWIHWSNLIWRARDSSDTDTLNVQSPPQWTADWNTDVDYDGFDWGGGASAFRWYESTTVPQEVYSSIAELYAAIGIEEHGIEVDKNLIFEAYPPVNDDQPFLLAAGANVAVDAGIEIPNVADFYSGSAPDLGAVERGTTPHYGPRDTTVELNQRTEYWIKH